MALVSECLQAAAFTISDDDSALIGDAYAARVQELARAAAVRAELEQERAIDQRQYLHSAVEDICYYDSVSIVIDRQIRGVFELARLFALLASEGAQEREIDRRQHLHAVVARVDHHDAPMMLVDRHSLRQKELQCADALGTGTRRE